MKIIITIAIIIGSIILLLILFLIYCIAKNKRGRYVKPLKDYSLSPSSPFYGWNLDELDHENTIVPWNEVFTSEVLNSKDLAYYQDHIVVVNWRSSQDSWDHLAGSAGRLLIDVKQKKQLDLFITTVS